VRVYGGTGQALSGTSALRHADTLTLDMDGLDPDLVVGLALNPRLKTDLGELCTLSLIVDVVRSTRGNHHPAFACFWIEVIDLHVDVVLGTGDAGTQVLFGEERPVREEDDRILKDLVLKRERERPVPAADWLRAGS
jgi:hypothetical protein